MSSQKIALIPQIPLQLIDAINNDQFAIFFGSGTSQLIGCSSWDELARALIETCFTTLKKDSTTITCINYKEQDALLQMKDPKKIITICQSILLKNDKKIEFFETITKALEPKAELEKKQNIYSELYGLRGLFITTNIDTHFDKQFHKSQIVYRENDFNPGDIDKSKLYHIHGSISDWDSVVISVKQYFIRYTNLKFQDFLKQIFAEKVILFIGYGLNEFEVLDFLITKSRVSPTEKSKHFILLPYYLGEDTLLEFDRHYFSELGITVIPYMKDEKGYSQVFDVIKQWNQEIKNQSQVFYRVYEKLKQAAENYDSSLEGEIFQYIKNDRPFELEFFKQLSLSQNPIPWLIPLKNNDYFNPKNNPTSPVQYGSYWNVMGALENIAKINSRAPQNGVTQEILMIINTVINYTGEDGKRVLNILTDRHIVHIIFLLPLNEVLPSHISFIKNCMHDYNDRILIAHDIEDSIVPRLLENNNKDLLLSILDIILDYEKCDKPSFEKYPSILGEYYLGLVLDKFSDKIISLCGIDAIDLALGKIEKIVKDDPHQFNIVWTPSIKVYEDNKDRYDNKIVNFVWKAIKQIGPDGLKELIKKLLAMDHPIFKRIAISVIDENYQKLNKVFWDYDENLLTDYNIKREVYELFTNHCKEFSSPQLKQIIDWIESKQYHEDKISEDTKRQGEYVALRKKEWLFALLPTQDPEIIALYDKYNSINPVVISHPGRSIVIEHTSGFGSSPISKEALLEKSNTDIAEYLNNFSEVGGAGSLITRHSLNDVFRSSVIDDPQKYVENLDPFLNVNRLYQYELIFGLSEAWRKDIHFKWANVIKFVDSIIGTEKFWTETYNQGEDHYRNWIISRIAILFEEGTKRDTHLIELNLLPDVERILIIILSNAESDLYPMGDLVNSVLNSNKGNIFSSIVDYSLCFGRHYRKTDEIRWPEKIKGEFERRLDPRIEQTVEFSVTLGKFLPNLCYLDKSWVRENINKIFPIDDDLHWNAAFTAYLFYSKVFKNIYLMLKENGHYSKAIQTEFKDPHINENLVHHVCIGYLERFEPLDEKNSLISQILDRWDSKQIIDLIRFLRFYGQKMPPDQRQMVIPLWKYIISKTKQDLENAENVKILAELNEWLSLVDDLTDEICDWLKISVKHIKPFEMEFIDLLIKHGSTKPKCCGEIFVNMVESQHYFDYQKDKIIELVTVLYDRDEKNTADKICNLYLQVGLDFLKPTYEKHM
jgi:hypothetical protein